MEAAQKLSEVGASKTAGKAAAKAVSNVFGFGAKVEDYPYRKLLIGETGASKTSGKAAAKAASTVANVFGFGAKVEDYPYRMLLIGETGAGKTSFLNLLCNCRMIKMLYREFNLELLQDFHDIKLENASARQMESKTSSAVLGEMRMGIIDTPGLGDSRGIEQDERNVKSIIDVL